MVKISVSGFWKLALLKIMVALIYSRYYKYFISVDHTAFEITGMEYDEN